MSIFPDDDKERKALPIFKMIVGYFPKAMREITRVCVANNQRFNPDREPADISWARGKSPDQLGSAFRHMLERAVDGKKFETVSGTRIYVLAEAAWRICAELELEIEREESTPVDPVNSEELCYCGECQDARVRASFDNSEE